MLHSCMLFPVVGDRLVERYIFILCDIIRLAHPDGLHVVEVLPLMADLLDLLGLLLLLSFVLIDFLNLGLILIILIVFLIISNFLLGGLLGIKLDRESDELRVFLHKILDTFLLKIFRHILFHVKNDTGTTLKSRIRGGSNCERSSCFRYPSVAFVVIVFRHNLNFISNKVSRVKSDTELSNHRDISSSREGFHESLSSGLGNSSKVIDKISLGHTNTRVFNSKSVVGLISNQLDLHLRLGLEYGRVRERLVADFIKSVTRIGDKLTKENLLVGIESIDNQRKKLVDIGRECVAFSFSGHV
mmetsp:Transcript_1825/g.3298  ORF Transcript_1825/g.3298 Transcript_1825/m.3298 type:complete len:301 (+) Transcript_1825:1307-2209(+)